MKKLLLYAAMIFLCNLFTTTLVQAQEEMKAKKFDNPEWKRISLIKFKHEKIDRVKEIIKDYFFKAAQKAGTPTPSIIVDLYTGEWDMMIVWDMKGIEDMDWEISPNDIKFMTAMIEIAGGIDKAKMILDEFSSLSTHETSYIGKLGIPK
ncbi:MAG TPA: hypothetical protein VFO70_05905 [Chitinophagaceae bacterium]|nr:hypothetical protein [Chitinophagaceae bacterium]